MRPTLKVRNQVSKSIVSEQKENMPRKAQLKSTSSFGAVILNKGGINKKDKIKATLGLKRKNDENCEGVNIVAKKRSALGNVTNAIEKSLPFHGKTEHKKIYNTTLKPKVTVKKDVEVPPVANKILKGAPKNKLQIQNKKTKTEIPPKNVIEETKTEENLDETLEDTILVLSQEMKLNKINLEESSKLNKINLEESSAYITASEGSPMILEKKVSTPCKKQGPPAGVEDFDKTCGSDPFAVSIYAMDIFNYYKGREKQFPIEKYMHRQPDISKSMRAILVDWMVEVQESFELNHESLYLAVKLVDLYLSKVVIKRDQLQLIGSTAIFIACKFDERTPPCIDDFLYICDDAYKMREVILLEMEMLKRLEFDLGIPLSYRFLRRYARCCKINMETLTFARYILEMSLMDYDLIETSDSCLAAAALYVALVVKENIKDWPAAFKYYSGFERSDITSVSQSLHRMLSQPAKDHLKTIRNKYSHKIFFEVAKIIIPETLI